MQTWILFFQARKLRCLACSLLCRIAPARFLSSFSRNLSTSSRFSWHHTRRMSNSSSLVASASWLHSSPPASSSLTSSSNPTHNSYLGRTRGMVTICGWNFQCEGGCYTLRMHGEVERVTSRCEIILCNLSPGWRCRNISVWFVVAWQTRCIWM